MDWQKLKERVTEEVLRQLASSGGTPNVEAVKAAVTAAVTAPKPGSGAPAAQPAEPPTPTAPAAVPACAVPENFTTDVLVVLAGSNDAALAVQALVAAGLQVTVVASAEARSAAIPAHMAACYVDPSITALERLVGAAKAVAVPALSLGAAEALGALSATCNACNAVIRALATGKRVIALRDGLVPPNGATWSARRQIDELADQLRRRGVTFVEPNRFTAEVARAAGAQVPGYRYSGVPTMGSAGRPGALTQAEAAVRFGLEQPAGAGGFVPAYQRQASAARPQGFGRSSGSGAVAPAQGDDFDRTLATMIDHTLLKPEATAEQVTKLCQEAKTYAFCSVCINPTWVAHAAGLLKGSDVKVCTVIGFPLGATSSTAKALEAADVIQKGATEVDMVLNVGALKSGQLDLVRDDIKAVVQAAKGRALVKVILETGLLTDDEKVKACQLAKEAGADFVKTSTGFGPGGATPADIALMRATVGPEMGVKASGGIRDWDAAQAVVKAGATRIGASASINIVKRVKADPKKAGKY